MVRECENCGSNISDDFYRVLYPKNAPIKNCPYCPDANKGSFEPEIEA